MHALIGIETCVIIAFQEIPCTWDNLVGYLILAPVPYATLNGLIHVDSLLDSADDGIKLGLGSAKSCSNDCAFGGPTHSAAELQMLADTTTFTNISAAVERVCHPFEVCGNV